MGIRYLNKYFVENCKECIQNKHMRDLYGKTIVVDISIYLYKYQMNNTLIENMYLMLSLFACHNITPIFIFDGKPPAEKRETLNKRYEDKLRAESECNELYKKMEDVVTYTERESMLETIQTLKRKCVFLKKQDILRVQELIASYGYAYYTAAGEADELCAAFVRHKKAWACLSEDMDMFVYGIPRVLRYISLMNNTLVLYETREILKQIGISTQDFMELCVMTGSDYTPETFTDVYTLFTMYKAYAASTYSNNLSFRKWLKTNAHTYSVTCMDDDTFWKIRDLFIRECDDNLEIIHKSQCHRRKPDTCSIQRILEDDGFVYPVACS